MKNKIEDLRNHLFATIEALLDEDEPMELDRAKAVKDVAQTVINSAKAEIAYVNATGALADSGFFPNSPRKPDMKGLPDTSGKVRKIS